ncbi:MAG TPA: hypothetical protein VKX41_11965 [Alloacidobacterium sp.]|jgi:hypothetical protein|nr:hypothetical protein [Alloacidobacterium sp.]
MNGILVSPCRECGRAGCKPQAAARFMLNREPALKATERMFRLCVFLADWQLVIFDERHTRSVSRGGAA